MDEKTLLSLISDNALVGATGGAALAFLYKIWRILQSDRKVDNLDNAERSFRDEMRDEIKSLKEDRRNCEEEKLKMYEEMHRIQKQITEYHIAAKLCHFNNANCPLFHDEDVNL